MNETELEKLIELIEQKTIELGFLQKLHKIEVGQNYIPASYELNSKKGLRQYCTEW